MGLGWQHILIFLVIALLLFGRGKISDLMGDVAKGIKAFKKGMNDDDDVKPAAAPPAPPPVIDTVAPVPPAQPAPPHVAPAPHVQPAPQPSEQKVG